MNYRFRRVKLSYQWNKQLSQTCCVRLIEHIQILNCRDPSHNYWAMTLGFVRYTAVFRKHERPQFVTTVISEKLATSNDCKHNIICVGVCQNKNIQSNWTYSMQTSSSWIFRSTQYMQRLCVFILDCLAWHLSADNLWHIWCQSAITFLIKKKKKVPSNHDFILQMARNARYHAAGPLICGIYHFHSPLDIWARTKVSQGGRVSEFIRPSVSTARSVAKCGTRAAPQAKPGQRH